MVETAQRGKPLDFSIMPSFRCNLNCWFCMYDCGPRNSDVLAYGQTTIFLHQFDWSLVNAFGFYGGEPSIAMPLYSKFIRLVPPGIPRFVITNGSWSTSARKSQEFLEWCSIYALRVIVSSTPEHIKHQNRTYLKIISEAAPLSIQLKAPDEIHAQGRAKNHGGVISDCKLACTRTDRNMRLGLKPNGDIVFQNCHGEYHIVQTYNEPFNGILDRAKRVRDDCLSAKYGGKLCPDTSSTASN